VFSLLFLASLTGRFCMHYCIEHDNVEKKPLECMCFSVRVAVYVAVCFVVCYSECVVLQCVLQCVCKVCYTIYCSMLCSGR